MTVSQPDIDNCVTVLGIQLSSFSAQTVHEDVLLIWETVSETENDRFEVERSSNGMDFGMIGTVKSKGSSNQTQNYQWLDEEPLRGISYYRLKAIDVDGKINYSSVVSTNFENSDVKIIPNPNNGAFQVIGLNGMNLLEVVDLKGNVLQQLESDQTNAYFNLVHAPGVYFLKITNAKTTQTVRFLITY